MKTQVLITVDLEFSIAGAFRDPERRRPVAEPVVFANIQGRSHGFGFLLETLAAHRMLATFFVETMNVHCFGDQPMGTVAHQALDRGHDVELHLHPCWKTFAYPDWADRAARSRPDDSMAGKSVENTVGLIQEGIATFQRWGLPHPVALRTGSLQVDGAVYQAMARVGLPAASNVGLAVFRPSDPSLQLTGGRHRRHGVLEVPVFAYEDLRVGGYRHWKNLTITGCSASETRWVLREAHRHGVETVVLLTHPFEFVKHDEPFSKLRPDRVNQRRFRNLCDFLVREDDAFEVVTFRAGLERWKDLDEEPGPHLRTPPWLTLGRVVVNQANRWI